MKIEIYRADETKAPTAAESVSNTGTRTDSDAKTGAVTPTPGEKRPTEHGGPSGPEPTRYGDWERNGRCYDF